MTKVCGVLATVSLVVSFQFANAAGNSEPDGSFEVVEVSQESLSAAPSPSPMRAFSGAKTSSGIGLDTCSSGASEFRTTMSRAVSIPSALQKSAASDSGPTVGIPELTVIDVALDQIINIGKKVWTVVQAGEPVMSLRSDVATALPATAPDQRLCWTELENWQAPKSRVFEIRYKNLMGMPVVTLQYRVLYIAGGSYQGRGRYIGYATIQATRKAEVLLGYSLDVKAKAPVVFNVGSKSSPVAGMNLEIEYTVKTALKHSTQSKVYYITGLGDFEELE